jgi:hypothetical protein
MMNLDRFSILRATVLITGLSGLVQPILGDEPGQAESPRLALIRPSGDKTHFVLADTNQRIEMIGFNYDRDDAGRLLEDYWEGEWETVRDDFREMKAMGANVVRVHLQLGKFMTTAEQPDQTNLDRLGKLVKLAEETGLYLDVTGLACYHKKEVPAWYNALDEAARWEVQAKFWEHVAAVCKESPAIFCYDLMNEPIVSGGDAKDDWLPGEGLAGKHYVQRITTNANGRDDHTIAKAWVERLTRAIRSVDDRHMITVGVIPWAQVFKGAKPLFHSPEVGAPLDFVSVHFYPKAGQLEETLEALRVYEVGKPLVIEEIFPLSASIEETENFLARSRDHVDGVISFYWGKTVEEYEKDGDLKGALVAAWLKRFPPRQQTAPPDQDGKKN